MKLTQLALFLAVAALISSCGSKKVAETPAPATTPATTGTPTASASETKAEKKAGEKKMTRPTKTAASDPNAKEVKCVSGADERLLLVSPKDGGCELQYTKSGETKVIATQISGDGRCLEVMNNVKKNLEGAQFTCQ